ncbi:MAG TPA: aminopeptidase P N-terminal domain-containing protein [Trueperaceae bacterium]|nr:aminopeptidase P N-terminal domain-containing protein [Trueperaceae bacterium]
MITLAEYATRRQRLVDTLRTQVPDPVAVIQGAPKPSAHVRFRQYNDLHYLCPVDAPHAYLVIDGREGGVSHLFLPHQPEHRLKAEGKQLSAGDPEHVKRTVGVDEVHGLDELTGFLERAPHIFTPMRRGEGAVQSWDTLRRGFEERIADPWDGRLDRNRTFIKLLRERLPASKVSDLGPTLNDMRLLKSAAEIELLSRAGRLSAHGLLAAMRVTRPGATEYQIEAASRYVYLDHGALDVSYRAISASGDNAWYGHYNANDALLKGGDLVLFDCGPDYHYYASDITRMWPVNGRYTSTQRQLYDFMVRYHLVLLELLGPGLTAEWVQEEAAKRMRVVVDSTAWEKPIYEQAARRALEFPVHLSHPVGMAVHDVGHYRGHVLQPGMVISVDPQLIIPEERKYLRVEDTVVITGNGIENLTSDAPYDLDEMEAYMAAAAGSTPSHERLWEPGS